MRSNKVAIATIIHVSDRLLSRVLDFVGALIVARILAPEAFGIVMLGVSALTMARGLTEFPVGNALIQKDIVDESDYATAFTLANLRGLLISLGLCSVAWLIAKVYNEPIVMPIIYCLAIAPLATGFASPMMAAHLRNINFVPLAIASLAGKLAGFIATVSIILLTGSFWALVIGLILSPLVTTIVTYFLAPSPISFSLKHWKEFFAFSSWMSLAGSVLIIYSDGTKFIIGLFVNTAALGIYTVGYSLSQTVIWSLAGSTIQTFFVGFAQIKNDRERLKKSYLQAQSILVTIFMPIAFGLMLIAGPLIDILLGSEWAEAALVVAWLAPGMAYLVGSSPAQAISMALNETRAMFFRNILVVIISLPLLIVSTYYFGLLGAVVARLIGSIINTFAGFMLVNSLIGLSVFKQVIAGWRSLIASITMFLIATFLLRDVFSLFSDSLLQQIVVLAVYIVVNAIIFIVVLSLLWVLSGRPKEAEMMIVKLASQQLGKFKSKIMTKI